MSENKENERALELRAMAHELLAIADGIEQDYKVRRSQLAPFEFASLATLGAAAAKQLKHRARRADVLDPSLLGEPGWDILLYLFVCRVEKKRAPTTAACGATGVPMTTALRWVGVLVEAGLVQQTRCETDQRVIFLELTEQGMVSMSAVMARSIRHAYTGQWKLQDVDQPRRSMEAVTEAKS